MDQTVTDSLNIRGEVDNGFFPLVTWSRCIFLQWQSMAAVYACHLHAVELLRELLASPIFIYGISPIRSLLAGLHTCPFTERVVISHFY